MPVAAVCPNPSCGKTITLADGATAPVAKCPACRTILTITKPSGTTPVADAARSTDKAPEKVGRFVVVGKLGAGAFGTVFRARDPHLDREVALKVPNPGVLSDPKRVERFLREAKAAAHLRHPNIVPVFDAGRDGDQYFIASAFIDGTPLSEAIGERGMDIRRAAEVVRELAGAVGYAHEQGIVHRDIKPSNVMLDAHDRPHLMDFGLAARADEAEKLTSDGAVMGTPAYMSPEQAGGQRADPTPAWDQYALGVVLYELLTGQTPFSGPPAAVIFQVLNNAPPPPRSIRSYIGRDLETICLKAMARDPAQRYPDCAALAEDLRRWLAREPITARTRGPIERAVAWVRENDTVAALLAVTFAAMALGTILAVAFAEKAQRRVRDADEARGALDGETRRADSTRAALVEQAQRADSTRAALVEQAQRADAAESLAKSHQRASERLGRQLAHLEHAYTELGRSSLKPSGRPEAATVRMPGVASEKFEYSIEGDQKQGTRRVLRVDIGDGELMEFVYIQSGSFMMGSLSGEKDTYRDETPQRRVEITRDFYLGQYEVTQVQYRIVTGLNPSRIKGNRLPVEKITWGEAKAFCSALSRKLGRKVELPSEAEWEYACRAGTTTPFHFGSKLNGDFANCDGNYPYGTTVRGTYKATTLPVGSYVANGWGLHDMHGNVWEWCQDYYKPSYDGIGTTNPIQINKHIFDRRVMRGGSWDSESRFCRTAHREARDPTSLSDEYIGFRVCIILDE